MRGKCLCGEIEFEIIGMIPKLYQCHCSLCRKQGGSTSNTATIVAAENFRWLSSQESISSWVKESGFRSDFCSQCGSPLPNPLRNSPYYWVPIGLLDNEPELEVAAHLFMGSKASWDKVSPPGIHFETIPEFSHFLELLHPSGL